jgi:hypothetical protein
MLGHVSGYVISSEEQERGDMYKTIIEQSSDESTITIFTKEHHSEGEFINPFCFIQEKKGKIKPYLRIVETKE